MELSSRQQKILAIVREHEPITGEHIAQLLSLTRATLRPDFTLLSMAGLLDARPHVGYFLTHRQALDEPCAQLAKVQVQAYSGPSIVVDEHASAYDAIVMLFSHDVGSLCVIKEGEFLTGVVSRKDLLKVAIGQSDLHQVPVAMVMTRMPNVATVAPDDSLLAAAQRLVSAQVDALPVVVAGHDGFHVIGRVTKTTITRFVVDLCTGQGRAQEDL